MDSKENMPPKPYQEFLGDTISGFVQTLKCEPRLNTTDTRDLLKELAQKQMSFDEFRQIVTQTIYPLSPKLHEAIICLRQYLTGTTAALAWVKKRCEDADSLDTNNFKEIVSTILEKLLNETEALQSSFPEPLLPSPNDLSDAVKKIFIRRDISLYTSPALTLSSPMTEAGFMEKLKELIVQFQQSKDETEKFKLNHQIKEHIKIHAPITAINFTNLDLSNLDLSGLALRLADFSTAIFKKNTIFKDCDLQGASFQGRDRVNRHQIEADFSNANCQCVDFSNCDLRNSIFTSNTKVTDMNLSGAWLSREILEVLLPYARWWTSSRPDRPEISLKNISLEDINLTNLNLSGLYLYSVYFKGANVRSTKFGDSDILGAHLKYAINLIPPQIRHCVNAKNARLPQWSEKQWEIAQAAQGSRTIMQLFAAIKQRKMPQSDDQPGTAPAPE